MIALTREASAQVVSLEQSYIDNHLPQALRNLGHASAEACLIVTNAPEHGLNAPRPYPALADLGFSWLKRGRYWIAYDQKIPINAGVFFETDDIPSRLR